jgi:hypothetical protein
MKIFFRHKKKILVSASILLWLMAACGIIFICFSFFHKKITAPDYSQANTFIAGRMQDCKNQGSKKPCLQQAAKDFLAKYPLKVILGVFQKNEKDPVFFENCHQTAHYLGQDEYRRLKSVRLALIEADETCLGGTYHGALEGYFMEKNLVYGDEAANKQIAFEVSTICGKPEDYDIPQKFYSCNHGLGHAVMFATDNDLVEALKLCDATKTRDEQELCYTGALMENASDAYSDIHPSKYFKTDDPLYPCYILDKKYQNMCYTYGVLSLYQSDIPKAIELCSTIPQDFRIGCFQTFGRDRTMISADPQNLYDQCLQIKDTSYRAECLKGLSYNLVVRYGLNSPLAGQLCSLVDQNQKSLCYQRIEAAAQYQTRDKNQLTAFCNTITEPDYRNACTQRIQTINK